MNTLKKFEVLLDEKTIQEKVTALGNQITRDYQSSKHELICVCILKGSLIFFADLIRRIELDLKIDFLRVSSYGEKHESSGVVQLLQDLSTHIEGKDVLIIEDIVDTGNTLDYLIKNLSLRKPNSLKLCSLLFKPSKLEKLHVSIDYLGFSIEDKYVVGYGLDSAERYRNLPYIGIMG